jgi:nicotinamidase-related amidase
MTNPIPLIVGRPALLVIGMAADAGNVPMSASGEPLHRLIAAARRNAVPVVRFEYRGGFTAPFALRPSRETGREPVHGADGSDYRITKWRPSCFHGTELEILLKGLRAETLVLCGKDTDVAIHYTFIDAHQHDYHARVAGDCVAGSSDAAHDYALLAMEYCQTGARSSVDALADAFDRLGSG